MPTRGEQLFKSKKITVMGLGLLGRGLGDVKYLAECGADLIVTDLKSADELKTSLAALKPFSNITYRLGEHRVEDFRDRDLILRAANTPTDSPYLAAAREQNTPITMSTALFAREAQKLGAKIIGVTGTRGKSTVTHLLFEILRQNTPGRQVFLGGNVKDVATLPFLEQIQSDDWAVLELDSWQLQGFGTEKISPDLAIFTTFYPDHLNYYHGDLKPYLADKAQIFLYQKSTDHLIIGEQAVAALRSDYATAVERAQIVGAKDCPSAWQLKLPGEHNRYNAALAIAAARQLGLTDEQIKTSVESFGGVPGRLELVAEKNGIKIYNDTTATTPEASLAALQALGQTKNIILIMGGADKNLDMRKLVEALPLYCKKVILLPGTGTDKLLAAGDQLSAANQVQSLAEAVTLARSLTQPGDTILLSPAFASFGPPPGGFKNEFDRGEQFNQLVKNI